MMKCILGLMLLAGAMPLFAQAPAARPATATQVTSRPTSRPVGVRDFATGVRIDWTDKSVAVRGRVTQRDVPLEFLACFPGKEHESIVLLDASATSVYQALGLIGLTPGSPPRWDEADRRYTPPEGDLVDGYFELPEPGANDAGTRRVAALSWVREREYRRPARQRPFVFCGSRPGTDGKLSADGSGAGLALVDFSDSLLALRQRFSSENAELWAEADPERIPPVGTPVSVVLQAARVPRPVVGIDFYGETTLDGRLEHPAECIDAIQVWRLSGGKEPVVIRVEAVLESDRRRFARQLLAAGIRDEWIEWKRTRPPASSPTSQPGGD